MSTIGFHHGAGRWWLPDLPAVDRGTIEGLIRERIAHSRKHPDHNTAKWIIQGIKAIGIEPSADQDKRRLAGLLLLFIDNAIRPLCEHLTTRDSTGDIADIMECDQWDSTIRSAVWSLLGIPANSWDAPGPPGKRLSDLIKTPPILTKPARLMDRKGGRKRGA